ncbi:uroporphyrinogen-III synthase [Salinisphaera sp.]|uniref:uroporphyrinogen-III synthase n=1 Tax=Salinisphaera sp. TaxID=1914330 RepID=UPI002D77236D|nr:uroporphyrinogen-III synthase [Salinisphaera sp.]HET7315404.1 uroporphyrinogen-III synthase [Salinisphaera sp.]
MPRPDLTDATVWLTRPIAQAEDWRAALTAAGARVWLEPLLIIEAPDDEAAAAAALDSAEAADIVIATSANAVAAAARLRPRWAPRGRLIAVGGASADALADYTGRPVATPARSDTEGLVAMSALASVAGRRVALLAGHGGRQALAQTLIGRGARLDKIALYRRAPAPIAADRLDGLLAADAVIVTSVEAWRRLAALTAGARRARLRRLRLVAASQRVVQQAGCDVDWSVEPIVIERMDATGAVAALDRVWPVRGQ